MNGEIDYREDGLFTGTYRWRRVEEISGVGLGMLQMDRLDFVNF